MPRTMPTIIKDRPIVESGYKPAPIFFEAGMHCLGCPASAGETLEEVAIVHGLDVDNLLDRLNNQA